MKTEKVLFQAEDDDPDRCQADGSGGEGQCRYLSIKALVERDLTNHLAYTVDEAQAGKNCPKHSGSKQIEGVKRKKLHDYRLQVWQYRVSEFSESEQITTLRGEIGILRLLIEQILNRCQDHNELMMYSHKISDLIMKVERTVKTCNQMETNMGMFLDRSKAMMFAHEAVQIISVHVHDPQAVDAISEGLISAMSKVVNNTEAGLVLEESSNERS